MTAGMEARHPGAEAAPRHPEPRQPDAGAAPRQPGKGNSGVAGLRPRDKKWRPMLRNENIDYRRNTFFVTIQAAFNKTLFGAIAGKRCELNALGRAVAESLATLGGRCDGVETDEYVVMPNHVHFIIKMSHPRGGETLGDMIGRFKSWTSKVYRDLKARGQTADAGTTPWQRDYWEKLVTGTERLEACRRYIRENPARWSRDRFGAATAYTFGNTALLNESLVAFVASQEASAAKLKPRLLWRREEEAGAEARHPGEEAGAEARHPKRPVISTFASAQERAVLAKALAAGRRFVMVCPGGIPSEAHLDAATAAACGQGRGLLVSPVPALTGINKQRAVFCNEYILETAAEAWAGDITPGRTLDCLLRASGHLKKGEKGTRC